jgi:predicted transcriptional regulator
LLSVTYSRFIFNRARKQAALSKRASNVLKLTQENQDLEKELKEMAERLEAIEKRSQELAKSQGSPPTSGTTSPPAGS